MFRVLLLLLLGLATHYRESWSHMKETFGDDHIEAFISDHNKTRTKWWGTRFAHKLALEKLYYSCVFSNFSCKYSKHVSSSRVLRSYLKNSYMSMVHTSVKFKSSCTVADRIRPAVKTKGRIWASVFSWWGLARCQWWNIKHRITFS